MSFIEREVKDRIVQNPRRYQLVNTSTGQTLGTFDLTPVPGTITEIGTPINKSFLQPIEKGIHDSYYQSGAMFLEDNTEADLIYTNNVLTSIDEKINNVLRRRTTLNYNSGNLISVNTKVYDLDGTTILNDYTDTLNIIGGVLESVTRTVII